MLYSHVAVVALCPTGRSTINYNHKDRIIQYTVVHTPRKRKAELNQNQLGHAKQLQGLTLLLHPPITKHRLVSHK